MSLATSVGVLLCAILIGSMQTALAAKPSNIGKVPGKAYVVRVSPDGKWLATWSEMGKAQFTLYVVNLDKGDRKEVVKVADPGGLCWIPGKAQLLYSKGIAKNAAGQSYTSVTYVVYDAATGDTKSVGELNDKLKSYQMDPIASEDGSMAFQMTWSTTGKPSFNIYFAREKTVKSLEAFANVAADYDLSSDGTMLAWYLHDTTNKTFNIATWNLELAGYKDLFEYSSAVDPAENHLMFKLDMPHNQAATLAVSSKDPTLNACVYGFADPKNLTVVPIRLAANEEAVALDWKGRSGILYLLVQNNKTKDYSIQEYDPVTRKATVLLSTKDPISYVDYAPGAQAYYYSVVNVSKKPETALVKLSLK